MIAEVAAYFPGALTPETPWPLFLALFSRVAMFEARAQLRHFMGTAGGIGAAFGGDQQAADGLMQRAYPGGGSVQMIENLASRQRQEEAGDG